MLLSPPTHLPGFEELGPASTASAAGAVQAALAAGRVGDLPPELQPLAGAVIQEQLSLLKVGQSVRSDTSCSRVPTCILHQSWQTYRAAADALQQECGGPPRACTMLASL